MDSSSKEYDYETEDDFDYYVNEIPMITQPPTPTPEELSEEDIETDLDYENGASNEDLEPENDPATGDNTSDPGSNACNCSCPNIVNPPKRHLYCSYTGIYRIQSDRCYGKYLTVVDKCGNNKVFLTSLSSATGVLNQWRMNATTSRFGNIWSRRKCSKTILASNEALSMGTGLSWKYKIAVVSDASCHTINLIAKRRNDERVYLATSLDCQGYRWLKTPTSPHTRFRLKRV